MADTKISALSSVTDLLSTDEFVLARSGATKKIAAVDLLAGSSGMVELFDSTLSGAQASFDATSLSSFYRDLLIELSLFPASGGNGDVYLRFNGDTGSNYDWVTGFTTGSIGGANTGTSDTKIKMDTLDTSLRYVARINVSDYADTGIHKYVTAQAFRIAGAAFSTGARWASNSAINQVTISLSSGNLQSGSRCRIYGRASS